MHALATKAKVMTFSGGTTVYKQGDPADHFFVIMRGTVEVGGPLINCLHHFILIWVAINCIRPVAVLYCVLVQELIKTNTGNSTEFSMEVSLFMFCSLMNDI